MITRDPDITRLLDRLEKRSLISRWRLAEDRRIVLGRIVPEGLKLLARLDSRSNKSIASNWATWGGSAYRRWPHYSKPVVIALSKPLTFVATNIGITHLISVPRKKKLVAR